MNWDAVAAVGTIGATIAALFVPFYFTNREWARQDRIREADSEAVRARLAETHHEICSTVDRVLAYREAAIAIFDSEPVYHVGLQAVQRINLNSEILLEILELLEVRPDISDGVVYSAVAAKRIAALTVEETGNVLGSWGTKDPRWRERIAVIEEGAALAAMAKERSDAVRNHYGLGESKTAAAVRDKYIPLAAAIKAARAIDGEPPVNALAGTYF